MILLLTTTSQKDLCLNTPSGHRTLPAAPLDSFTSSFISGFEITDIIVTINNTYSPATNYTTTARPSVKIHCAAGGNNCPAKQYLSTVRAACCRTVMSRLIVSDIAHRGLSGRWVVAVNAVNNIKSGNEGLHTSSSLQEISTLMLLDC